MPLPDAGIVWPPPVWSQIRRDQATWAAWYAGDRDALAEVYGGATGAIDVRDHVSQYRGGLMGAVARWFWGQPQAVGEQRTKLHVPIASDICQGSADLLFSEPPKLKVADEATQKALDIIVDDRLHTDLAEAAEIDAALGDVYLRVTWDTSISKHAFLTSVHADRALPEFRWGRLVAVTFWRDLHEQDGHIWRHLERHELDAAGVGMIYHGLYQGTREKLGRPVPLAERPETAAFAALVNAEGFLSTQSPGLAVVHVPNQRPQRRRRLHPVGAALGRSDLDGIESHMDALDEVYTSWMRDIRLGKGRIVVSNDMLDNMGPGKGSWLNLDREVFSPVKALVSGHDQSGLPIEVVQFAIRVQEHQATAQQLVEDILRTAGYSAQTFGEGAEGAATATEVMSRERRSFMTRDRKIRHWRPALSAVVEKLLAVDKAVFNTPGIVAQRPTVEFGDSVQESTITLAQTAQALRTAQAASTRSLVAMVHPEWDAAQVEEEAGKILAEQGMNVPNIEAGENPFGL